MRPTSGSAATGTRLTGGPRRRLHQLEKAYPGALPGESGRKAAVGELEGLIAQRPLS